MTTNYRKRAERRLNRSEGERAMKAIAAAQPGDYTVRELLQESWEGERRPRAFGKWFKASAVAGDLAGLRWAGRRSNRSQYYLVLPVAGDSASHAMGKPEVE